LILSSALFFRAKASKAEFEDMRVKKIARGLWLTFSAFAGGALVTLAG